MELDHLETGEAEATAREEVLQGAPLLVPSARVVAGPVRAAYRGLAVAAALLAAGGLCALAAGRGQGQEPSSQTVALPSEGLGARLQLSEVTMQTNTPSGGFSDVEEAFQAKINKNISNFTGADKLAYEQYRQKVVADQSEMVASGGDFAKALANAVQEAQVEVQNKVPGASEHHTPMDLGGVVPLEMGKVRELYTFGAPGTAVDPLYDATRPDGCIRGMRTYSRSIRFSLGVGTMFKVYDPVAWICNLVNYKHPHMESMQALQTNDLLAPVSKCGQGYLDPGTDGFFWVTGHLIYPKILNTHTQAATAANASSNNVAPDDWLLRRRLTEVGAKQRKVEKAALMAHFAFMNYRETPMIGADALSWGWNLVGRACAATDVGQTKGVLGLSLTGQSSIARQVDTFVASCDDHAILYQNNQTLDCALVFEGTHDLLDWLANLNFAASEFCGLGLVHGGFRNKVLRMVGGTDYAQVIRPNLKHCRNVDLVGHSLGAAQAELFTACANRMLRKGTTSGAGYNDYRLFTFNKGRPKRLPLFFEEHAKGVFLRNKGTGMCMDVKGTLSTNYRSSIILFYCEFPNAGYNMDQRWEFKANGLIANMRSGKCMTTAVGGSDLVQWTCDPADAKQQWDITANGLLQNRGSKLCADGDLNVKACPLTEQRFEIKEDGHVVNKLSGLCLDVKGDPGMQPGDDVVLWHCENKYGTDQLWELTAEGVLKNKLSGLCMNLKPEQGREDRPSMMLGPCNTHNHVASMVWTMTPDGFLRNRMGKCLDVKGSPVQPGSLLSLRSCQESTLNVAGVWATMPGGFIKNIGMEKDQQYRCIMVSGEVWDNKVKSANGTSLLLTPCKINTDQKWEIMSSGFIRNTLGGQKCLDLMPPTLSLAGKMWIMNCDRWDDPSLFLDLKWAFRNGNLRSKLRQTCVGYSKVPGILEVLNCSEAKSQVQGAAWTQRPDGGIQVGAQCLDVSPAMLPGGRQPVSLKPCLPTITGSEQEWDVMQNGFVRNSYHSLCMGMDPVPGHLEIPNGLFLQPCPTTTQLWSVLPSGQIQNRITGKCIDAMRNVTGTSWWDITQWDCDATRKEQQWEQVA